MIQANELRIGNWMGVGEMLCSINSIHTVPMTGECFVRVEGFISNDRQYQLYIDQLEPIRLNSRILEKCGFKNNHFIQREFDKKGDYNFHAVDHYEDGYLIICNFMQGGIMIKSLHHLQNIYFVLTGEELPFKPAPYAE